MHACGTSEGGQLQAAVASTLRWARHATREIEEAGHMATSYRHAEGRHADRDHGFDMSEDKQTTE